MQCSNTLLTTDRMSTNSVIQSPYSLTGVKALKMHTLNLELQYDIVEC